MSIFTIFGGSTKDDKKQTIKLPLKEELAWYLRLLCRVHISKQKDSFVIVILNNQ